ncbi:MAG: hypothetical protein JW940_12535 [Polyangiaceae bacterium]|nr:hypothetical protein [Polyangiaceae bacterium]
MKNFRFCCALPGLSVLMSFVPAALAAEGDPCLDDADCGDGYECDLPPTTSSASSGAMDSAGDAKLAPPDASGQTDAGSVSAGDGADSEGVTEGTCERAPRRCTTDADCDEYHVCVGDVATVCSSDGACGEVDPGPRSGTCEGRPVSCSKSSDCPSGTQCVDGTCTLDLASCEKDSECEAGYECLSPDVQECSVAPCSSTDPTCEPEIVCEPGDDALSFCFPKAKACAADDDCSAGWRCYDMEDEEDAPEDWAGVDKGCLPPELVGVFEGYVQLTLDGVVVGGSSEASDSSELGGSSDAKGTSDNSGDLAAPSNDGSSVSGEADDNGSAGARGQSASSSKSKGGCTLSGSGRARTSLFGGMALALLAAAVRRRRAG